MAIGLDRLPSLCDPESLPYVEALVIERRRSHMILPLAQPRTHMARTIMIPHSKGCNGPSKDVVRFAP